MRYYYYYYFYYYYYYSALGAQPPLGFWDPLGLLTDADQERFDRLRYVEVKHGRISMLAVLGHIVTASGYRLPGDIAPGVKFADCAAGLASIAGPKGKIIIIFII